MEREGGFAKTERKKNTDHIHEKNLILCNKFELHHTDKIYIHTVAQQFNGIQPALKMPTLTDKIKLRLFISTKIVRIRFFEFIMTCT